MSDRMPPIETDPLGAIRSELIAAGWRRKAVRDRRRRVATIVSTMLATFVLAVGGATALGVDVPIVSDALDRIAPIRDETEDASRGAAGDPAFRIEAADVKPGADSVGEPVDFDVGDGSGQAAPYLNVRDQLCVAFAYSDGQASQGSCDIPAAVGERLREAAVDPLGILTNRSTVLVSGYLGREVDEVEVIGPEGRLDVRTSRPWRPKAPGGVELRIFVAVERSAGGAESGALQALNRYRIRARLSDGRTVTVHR